MDDHDLIRRAAEGDAAAFEILVERKRERVFFVALSVVGDRELARDVAQDVFLRLYRVVRRFRKGGAFDAWLYRIAINLAIDALRRERPHREVAALEDVPEAGLAAGSATRSDGAARGGAGPLGPDEVRRIFIALSSRLGRKQRAAFVLREIEGLSTTEVAAILKTRESTVRNHILQARRILQEGLRREYPEYCPAPRRTRLESDGS